MKILGATLGDWRGRLVKLSALIWRRLLFRTTVVAITGSVGKTTTKELLARILSTEGLTLATLDTNNTAVHVARTLLRARPWHRFVVVEIGTDSPGWIRSSACIAHPDIAVILNVGKTHTDRFPTLEDTAREKSSLLDGLGRRGVAILNQDDFRVAAMTAGRGCRVVRFGRSSEADVLGTEISATWPQRLSLSIKIRSGVVDGTKSVETQLVGEHWASSVLAATAVALECGVPLTRIAEALKRVEPTPGRLDPRILPSGAAVLRDDYNGSLETFAAAFRVLREAQASRKILAITTVSDSPEGWDKRLRRIAFDAAAVCDVIVLVGVDKDTDRAVRAAAAAGFRANAFHRFVTMHEAAEFLRGCLKTGDLLLLRGRSTDHMARLFHALVGNVQCWRDDCNLTILCDRCPRLFAENGVSLPIPLRVLESPPPREGNR
jgi:UDP-N-acetylmuramoyl-tripeptide--D-alanyl-D-alanine ligase